MKRPVLLAAAFSLVAMSASAVALEDPIKTRQTLMDANGAAAGLGGGIMKGEIPFNPVAAASVLQTMRAVAVSFGDYFPEGSEMGDTKADPKIWTDSANWQAALAKFQQDTEAALATLPKEVGSYTLDQFKGAFGQVAQNCRNCHQNFRISN
ncbi:c-type cytochrome [Propylenella binzhouense]|uniref:Cytochrome c n=1 Tax=Propylenella binzhouense TaxID=2555902 RepID=A0A964T4N3_9HYPH|nr:cytochrome c [Propylenella binzhouense]MYZ48388.1 cytochrome c [Propylenella binzhouense]